MLNMGVILMINQYVILEDDDITGLALKANELVGLGYSPVGGVTFIPQDVGTSKRYLQVMLKALLSYSDL